MRRLFVIVSLVAAGLSGCFDMHTFKMNDGGQKEGAKAAQASPPPPIVRAEDVNDANSHAMAQALSAEMEYDADHVR
jgi:hypothetical protein